MLPGPYMKRHSSLLWFSLSLFFCCRFPADAHEHISHASKIPTIIYYDRAGNVKAVGAEAVQETIYRVARTEHWVKAEWYGSRFQALRI